MRRLRTHNKLTMTSDRHAWRDARRSAINVVPTNREPQRTNRHGKALDKRKEQTADEEQQQTKRKDRLMKNNDKQLKNCVHGTPRALSQKRDSTISKESLALGAA